MLCKSRGLGIKREYRIKHHRDDSFMLLEQVVTWPVRIAPTASGRGLYKDSALLSLTIDPGVHGSPWSTRRSIGANCANCVPCNAWLTVATVYINNEILSSR